MERILVYGMTKNRGGIEAYLMNYFRILSAKGIMFDFVTDYEEMAYTKEAKELGAEIYYIPSRRKNIVQHISALHRILKHHSEYKTVYFNILSASEVFTMVGTLGIKNIKRVVHSHNNSVKTIRRHKILRPILNLFADTRLACSREAGEFMFGKKKIAKNKVQIINNAIDIDLYLYNPEIRKKVRMDFDINDKFVVGHVGRLCYQKNSLFVLEIFSEILKLESKAVLMLVGEGEDRELVENKIKELKLDENVILTGMRHDVNLLLQAMDVFILPSRFEGLPVTVIEAQAADLPIVVSEATPITAKITEGLQQMSIMQRSCEWAQTVIRMQNYQRRSQNMALRDRGYDILLEGDKLAEVLKC